MCFSASASFGAGILLGVIGVVTLKKAKNFPQRLLAAIPLIFSIQQFSEGVLWLALMNSHFAAWQQISTHIFLVFAYMVWPVWIPLTIMLLERNKKRRKLLQVLFITGVFISIYIAYCMLSYSVRAVVFNYHIHYTFNYPRALLSLTWVSDAFYFIATILPPFISSVKKMWLFGIIILTSYLVSRIFFNDAVVSVWCYFAAILSIVILLILISHNKSTHHKKNLIKESDRAFIA